MAKTSATPAPTMDSLRLGDSVMVRLGTGITHLRNTESGANFEPGEPTPQTVTTTLLRRLQDGDLVLV